MCDIKITQFVNPHLFYYQLEQDEFAKKPFEDIMLKTFPDRNAFLQTLQINRNYSPSIDEIVGHYNMIENKWIRAQVDHVTFTLQKEKVYFLFAIDYGFSLESIGKWLWPLPKFMKTPSTMIFKGGIMDIIPCDFKVNPITAKQEYMPCLQWNTGAVMQMCRMMDSCQAMKFTPIMRTPNGQVFGSLEFKTVTLEYENAATVLMDENLAQKSLNFVGDLAKLPTRNFPRWQQNDRNSVIFGLSTISPQLSVLMVDKARADDGGDIESFFVDQRESTANPASANVRKLSNTERAYFEKWTTEKVLSWQAQNAQHFLQQPSDDTEEQEKEKVNDMMKLLENCAIAQAPKPDYTAPTSSNTKTKYDEEFLLEPPKTKKPQKINFEAIQNEMPPPPTMSMRAASKPKPAGYIWEPTNN